MSAVYALFDNPDAAQAAVESLRAQGVTDDEITIVSSEPFEDHEFSRREHWPGMFRVAALGGIAGLSAAYALTSMTARAWPIVTGGMPIVSMWPNLIVMFEMTMLGAVLATVATLVWTARLGPGRSRLYDPAVSTGLILVGLEHPRHPVDAIGRALTNQGGVLKTLP